MTTRVSAEQIQIQVLAAVTRVSYEGGEKGEHLDLGYFFSSLRTMKRGSV